MLPSHASSPQTEQHWLFYFADNKPTTKLKGMLPLRSFCNAKLRPLPREEQSTSPLGAGNAADFTYLAMIPDPEHTRDMSELILRTKDVDQAVRCVAAVSTCSSQSNRLAQENEKAFNREMFYLNAAQAVPRELTAYAMVYLEAQPAPVIPGAKVGADAPSSLASFLRTELNALLCCRVLDKDCKRRAKLISGVVTRTVDTLYYAPDAPSQAVCKCPPTVWRHIQALSLSQMRQLFETVLWDAVAPETEYEAAQLKVASSTDCLSPHTHSGES